MLNNLGTMIKKLRKEQGLTQLELAEAVWRSRQYISFLENNERPLADEIVFPLSQALNFNFEQYVKNKDKYETTEHYILSHELKTAIDTVNTDKIQDLLKNKVVQTEFDYGSPHILKMYCTALICKNIEGNLLEAKRALLSALQVKDIMDMYDFTPVFHSEERYYSCIALLSNILSVQKQNELALTILINTINFIEKNFFEDSRPNDSATIYFRKLYIALINNHSHILFMKEEYDEALIICNKGLNVCISTDMHYGVEIILKLKIEVLYKLGKINQAQETYNEFKILCKLKKCDKLFNDTNKLFNEKLQNIETSNIK